ncbi:MAG: hypothetical protein AAFW83_08550 [Pseudomonadota bacterium]
MPDLREVPQGIKRPETFEEFVKSPVIEANSQAISKGAITVASMVAIFIALLRPWGFGIWWVLVFPLLWFFVSLMIAFPTQIIRLRWAYSNWNNPSRAKLGTSILDTLMYVGIVPIVYFGLKFLHSITLG